MQVAQIDGAIPLGTKARDKATGAEGSIAAYWIGYAGLSHYRLAYLDKQGVNREEWIEVERTEVVE